MCHTWINQSQICHIKRPFLMPMVVDENIHYRLMKLIHSSHSFDVGLWLCHLPLLYGVWHPYKFAVLTVYRVFFPIFALLETTMVEVGKEINGMRKVLHVEKIVAALLLIRHSISARAKACLQVPSLRQGNRNAFPLDLWLGDDVWRETGKCNKIQVTTEISTDNCCLSFSFFGHPVTLLWLWAEGMLALVDCYCPLLFAIGSTVRECTWNGRTQNSGSKAKDVLVMCFLLLVKLLGERAVRTEYVRTLAIALLSWTPWMDTLPACCFNEESCEAMLF